MNAVRRAVLQGFLAAVALAAGGCVGPTLPPSTAPAVKSPPTARGATQDSAPAPPAPAPPADPATSAAQPPVPELRATIQTARGPIRIRLMVREAPLTCANFVNLALRGAYDQSQFHDWTRVIRQCGGPAQRFEPGYMLRREFSAKLMFDGPGMVAMQKAADGEHAHATQFFITVKEQSRWDLDIPIFAVVEQGQGVVDATEKGDAIDRIVIEGDASALLARFPKELAAWNAALDRRLPRSAKSKR